MADKIGISADTGGCRLHTWKFCLQKPLANLIDHHRQAETQMHPVIRLRGFNLSRYFSVSPICSNASYHGLRSANFNKPFVLGSRLQIT